MSSLRIDPLSSGVEVREKTRNRRRKRRAGHQRCHSVPFRGTALTTWRAGQAAGSMRQEQGLCPSPWSRASHWTFRERMESQEALRTHPRGISLYLWHPESFQPSIQETALSHSCCYSEIPLVGGLQAGADAEGRQIYRRACFTQLSWLELDRFGLELPRTYCTINEWPVTRQAALTLELVMF